MRQRKVVGLYLATLLSFAVLYGAYMTFIPLFLADRFSSSALEIGPIMTVGSLTTALTASRIGKLSGFLPAERMLPGAFVFFAASFVAVPFLPGHWWATIPVALFGIGQGLNYPVVLTLLAELAPPQHRAVFMSVNGMVIRTGQALGPLLMGGVFFWGGMGSVFFSATGICVVVFLILPRFIGTGSAGPPR